MSRLVQAAKHYGCPKKRYKFEMKIHKVVLTSEKRKLFTRVLWTRSNKKEKSNKKKFKTKWCEGVENYNIDESISHEATIYFASNTNQVQSKQTKITLQIRERIDGKDQKFAKFSLDLAKYVDILSPHRIFYQRLNYEKARRKAQLIFTIKSMEILSDGTISDYTDDDDDDDESQSNYTEDDNDSILSEAGLNTIQNSMIGSKSKSKRHSAPNALAIHSDISGKQLKNRHYRNQSVSVSTSTSNNTSTNTSNNTSNNTSSNDKKKKANVLSNTVNTNDTNNASPTPSSQKSISAVTITRRDPNSEKFIRSSQFQFNSTPRSTPRHNVTSSGSQDRIIHDMNNRPNSPTTTSDDISQLKRKLKLYEDKHKKYKYKYAKLSKKVEEQEIEARCQQDQICRLKRIEEDVKEQKHTMTKYKKKIKMLTKERESLKKTLQKRNQTIIHLNKENSKLKEQVMSLQTVESVRYNSDDNITEFNDYQNDTDDQSHTSINSLNNVNNVNNNPTNSILGSNTSINRKANISPSMHQKTYYKHPGYHPSGTSRSHSNSNSMSQSVDNNEESIIDGEELKRLEQELNLSKQNQQNWQNTVKQLQTLVDKQIDDKSLAVPSSVNGKDEVSTPATISTISTIKDNDDINNNNNNNNTMNQLIETLNNTSIHNVTPGNDGDDENNDGSNDDVNNIDKISDTKDGPSESILKLVQEKKALLQKQTDTKGFKQTDDTILNTALYINTLKDTNIRNDSILSDIQQQWMQAETEKLHYKKLYEKEKAKINHYKSKTSSAHKKYEKSEIELSIVRHQFEELQQKHEVMEEVYMKLKQDLTSIMDRYSKLEYEYEKVQQKLRQREQYLLDDDNRD